VPTKRGWVAFVAGLLLWLAARFVGSPDLHMVAVGIIAMPFLSAAFVHWSQVRLTVRRHLSAVRVFPGTRVTVSITVENEGRITVPFLLLEDALPSALGRPAHLVVTGIPARNDQTVSYSVLCRSRGRFAVGPLSILITDPFGLARVRVQTMDENELVVYPKVEDVEGWNLAMQGVGAGESAVRHLHRSAAEFFTMREYVTGDDLRRIHWPSVARTGQLMIRQDESTRRSTATVFLDNRQASLGDYGSPAFERGVSLAATVGRLLTQKGFIVHLAAVDAEAVQVDETRLLERLAAISPARVRASGDALVRLRATARSDTSLAFVSAPPPPHELQALIRTGSAFGRKLAILIYPVNIAGLPAPTAHELEARAAAARASLQHAGWEVLLMEPDGRLGELWQSRPTRRALRVGSVS
jgi:uncharacterized protein (DUF58 family)